MDTRQMQETLYGKILDAIREYEKASGIKIASVDYHIVDSGPVNYVLDMRPSPH